MWYCIKDYEETNTFTVREQIGIVFVECNLVVSINIANDHNINVK